MAYTAFSTIGLVFVPLVAEAAGDSTATIAAWALVVAIVTVFLVAVQIAIARRQTQLAADQLEIARTQTTILKNQEAILTRKEDLSIAHVEQSINTYVFEAFEEVGALGEDSVTYPIPLSIINSGKTVRGVMVEVWTDEEIEPRDFSIFVSSDWVRGASEILEDKMSGEWVDRTIHTRQYPDLLLPGDNRVTELHPQLEVTVPRKSHTYFLHV